MVIKFSPRKLCRVISFSFKLMGGNGSGKGNKKSDKGSSSSTSCGGGGSIYGSEIKWELRPGGMLVQKRECGDTLGELISIRVSTVSTWHDISIQATSTFGELKMILSLITSLEPREQRVLFKGKEREDSEYLHMVGVRDKDKVLLLEDPAIKETKKKLHGQQQQQQHTTAARTPMITI